MSKIVSKILGLFLSEVNAGACVPTIGCCCVAPGQAVSCTGVCVKQNTCIRGSKICGG